MRERDQLEAKHSRRLRIRVAAAAALSAVILSGVVAVAAVTFATMRTPQPETSSRSGAARLSDEMTVIIVTSEVDGGVYAARLRGAALRWVSVAAAVSIIPAFGAGWWGAGRFLGRVDDALAEVAAAEGERRERVQEVVHELRTPLAVMGTNLELAGSDPTLDPSSAGFIEAARRAAERMGRTVDDLAGHGRLAVRSGDVVDLGTQARAVVAEHIGPAHSRRIHLLVAESSPLTVPGGDRDAVRTALGNLVGNAVRLAPGGSAIEVTWGRHHEWGWIAVSDEGPGIPTHLHARVFERGWRGPHDRDRRVEDGSRGLGLTIARQVIEAQGGAVTVESEEGGGSTFTVWLPLDLGAEAGDVVGVDGIHPRARPWSEAPAPAPVV
jgi:signal transduction histidine kinase